MSRLSAHIRSGLGRMNSFCDNNDTGREAVATAAYYRQPRKIELGTMGPGLESPTPSPRGEMGSAEKSARHKSDNSELEPSWTMRKTYHYGEAIPGYRPY